MLRIWTSEKDITKTDTKNRAVRKKSLRKGTKTDMSEQMSWRMGTKNRAVFTALLLLAMRKVANLK